MNMMRKTKKMSELCLIVLACYVIICKGDFAPSHEEETTLTNCLLKESGHRCRHVKSLLRTDRSKHNYCKHKVSGSIVEVDANITEANEYICALNDYQNSKKTTAEVKKAILDIGSCSNIFKSVRKTWKAFLGKRRYEMHIRSSTWQRTNGTRTTARFPIRHLARRYSREDIHDIDLVISRSGRADIETYGRYKVTLYFSLTSSSDDKVIIHQSVQATCPSGGRKRYFVVGLNENGRRIVSDWFMRENDEIEFDVEVLPQKQIRQGGLQRNVTYHESEFDVEIQVSAIVSHLESKTDILPLPTKLIDRSEKRGRIDPIHERHKRSIAGKEENCHREHFFVNYRINQVVVRPLEFDLGECVGSCKQVFFMDLNATNHALSMQSEKRYKRRGSTNPIPTVCCVPISFRRFHYVKLDERGSLMSSYVDNMVSEYCGCR
uniref:uncharacterized protein LOC120346797 isoform X1 n=1 Tax=Styela clava TaxID=7725 RepID=UPI00193A5798|nr:uncharacterized protein LOC120346797 isoform X1 [Styela clava]